MTKTQKHKRKNQYSQTHKKNSISQTHKKIPFSLISFHSHLCTHTMSHCLRFSFCLISFCLIVVHLLHIAATTSPHLTISPPLTFSPHLTSSLHLLTSPPHLSLLHIHLLSSPSHLQHPHSFHILGQAPWISTHSSSDCFCLSVAFPSDCFLPQRLFPSPQRSSTPLPRCTTPLCGRASPDHR